MFPEDPGPEKCPFCQYCSDVEGNADGRVVYRDDKVIVFHDRFPKATVHLLVSPIEHLGGFTTLNATHADLIDHMHSVGQKLLHEQHPGHNHRIGFHRPPFTSVHHLHLHCMVTPFVPWYKRWKYSPWLPTFRTVESVKARLHGFKEHA